MKIVTRYKVELYLASGHTVRLEVTEYEFNTTNGEFTGYTFKGMRHKASFNPSSIVGYKVVGMTYRLS